MTERPKNQCGSCSMCCKLLDIPELSKPGGRMCEAMRPGVGCTIYADRPAPCREFQCGWLFGNWQDQRLRPDKSKVMFVENRNSVAAFVDPNYPENYKRPEVLEAIAILTQQLNLPVIVTIGHNSLRKKVYRFDGRAVVAKWVDFPPPNERGEQEIDLDD